MEIVKGYNRGCKDSLGGIKNIWLTKWMPYSFKQIQKDNNYLIKFPDTLVYKFESIQNPVFNETYSFEDDFFNQTISLYFSGIDAKKERYLKCVDLTIIVQDRNNIFHIFGIENGLRFTNVSYTTGGAKAEFNGITLDFSAKESYGSLMFTDLENAGFIDNGTEETFYLMLQNRIPFKIENNNNLIRENG